MKHMRDVGSVVTCIEGWLADRVREAGAKGIVAGLSGGVDSAVVAALGRRVFDRNMLALVMPCHSDPSDAADARLVAESLDLPVRTIDLSATFDCLTAAMEGAGISLSDMARANVKARLRMVTLYGAAQSMSYLVCGTGNRSEWETGYFTKHGDSASDLLPLIDLLKCEVRAVAAYLGIPEKIITKAPTAGLWAGQTDEGEMGFGYDQLDRYLATGEADPAVREKIENMRAKSEHKRRPAAACKLS